jgi:hypothetical protein
MTHHPHVHGIVPGGGLSTNGLRRVSCRADFFLPERVLSRLFRPLFTEDLNKAFQAGELKFFGEHQSLADEATFVNWLKPMKQIEWVVYAKRPFARPKAVLADLSRYEPQGCGKCRKCRSSFLPPIEWRSPIVVC